MQDQQRIEPVMLQRLTSLCVERRAAPRGAEGAVAQVASGAARDLADLGGRQPAMMPPSNLRSAAKATWSTSRLRPMPIASVAIEEVDVARSGRARPAHCACAAKARPAPPRRRRAGGGSAPRWRRPPLPRRRRWRAARQARELLLTREGQLREARAGDDAARRGCSGSISGRMVAAPISRVSSRPRMVEQAVGEDMAAVEVGGELDFVDGHERRHRDRAASPRRWTTQ